MNVQELMLHLSMLPKHLEVYVNHHHEDGTFTQFNICEEQNGDPLVPEYADPYIGLSVETPKKF